MTETSSVESVLQPKVFTPEWLQSRSTLEIEAKLNGDLALSRVNELLGTAMMPRPEGFHVTVIGPAENECFKLFTQADLDELEAVSNEVRGGKGVTVAGIGFIDGSTMPGIRDADKVKKTSFVALDIPRLNDFREKHGLVRKDFHVTLGFDVGDIHMQVVGTEPGSKGKMKDILASIPKKADSRFDDALEGIELDFAGIDGQEKQKAQEKPVKSPKIEVVKEYDPMQLRENIITYEREGRIPSGSLEGIIEAILTGKVNELGKTHGPYMKHIRAAMIASEK